MMAKSKTSATVLTCDICGFKVANPYIFKRHLHKCFTLHGIASKRSTPRHPIRLKGTEGLKSTDNKLRDEISEGAIENSSKEDMDQPPHLSGSIGFGEEEEGSIASSVSSQWGVTNSPQVFVDTTLEKKEDTTMTTSEVESPSPTLPARAKFERKYSCETCPFETLKSRNFLYHLRDEHGEKLNVYECHLCDYASRYNNKLARHMSVHKKPGGAAFSVDPAILSTQRLRVKPIKLKRLSVKTSSEFEVSPAVSPKVSKASPSASSLASSPSASKISFNESTKTELEEQAPKPNKQKEVFKMVLAEDGSHHYQCRSCLFYANSPHSVKKHHVLCHSKVLNCSYCPYYTTEQAEYYEHILTHGGTGKLSFLKCEDCSYVTTARSNYEKHRSFHGADFPFHCTVCNFTAESESKVKRHMATQHTNSCSDVQDEVSFAGKPMAMEMMDEGTMKTEKVLKESQSRSSVLDMEDAEDFQDPLRMKYRCPQCPVVCLRRGNFTRHLVARHNYTQASASQTSKTTERKLLRKRKLAVKLPFSQSVSVKKRRQLVYAGENLKCSECSYTAKWPSDLRRHRMVHTIVKRFKCVLCNNKYKYAGDLNVHMRRDHLTEPHNIMAKDFVSSEVVKKASPASFRCPICPFTTHSKANLEQHSKQHKDIEKTFQCRLCKYQTYWRGDVGRHLFRHHGILLGKDPQEIENYFIHRPEIRPLTKQPQYHNLTMKTPHSMKVESENGMNMDSHDFNEAQKSNINETILESAYKSLVTGKEGQMVCSYVGCDYKTSTPERFEAHLAYHENLKQYMCPTCGKRTNWKWDVVKHMHKVHQDSHATNDHVITLSLEEARASIREYMLKREKKMSGTVVYLCSLCDFKSRAKSHVVNHLAINHKDENGRVLNKYLPKSRGSGNLTSGGAQAESADHVNQSETGKRDLFVDPSPEELAKTDKPFACALCQKAEVSKAEVRKHYSYAHPYKDVRVIYTADGTEFDFTTNEIYSRKSDQLQETEERSGTSHLKIVRHDSKYSNPKMHGYVKPFKCSICGVRSNWKWDLKKHLRAKHPNQGGFVIMLSIAEAKSTYALECSPSHPKEVNRQPMYKLPSEQKPSSSSNPFKHPYRVKGETYDSNYGIFGSLKSPASERVTNFDPRRRQWKCSGCSYISNWRRNMARHIQRHHGLEKNRIRIIALHLLNKDSQQKFLTGQSSQDITANWKAPHGGPVKTGSNSTGSCPLWSCPKCSFRSNLRTHIIIHMQKHGMKPFSCAVCHTPFMNRGPLHRHIQKGHQRSDYLKLCKVNIDFGDSDSLENVFICCLCQLESTDRSTIIDHIEKEHDIKEYEYHIVTMQRKSHQNQSSQGIGEASADKQTRPRRMHHCQLCPYRSQKKSMLVFHMTYHKPTPANRFKCKYCPYYVSTSRLLHQHQRKWHTDNNNRLMDSGSRVTGWEQMQSTPPVSPLKQGGRLEQSATSRRHFCEKCPYTTNSKNDFIYHKQFHRPKRTAEYKCEYCDYWVVHKRLLKQHMRLHTKKAAYEPEVSPVKSVYSDPGLVYDPVELTELAAIKQQMISAKITPSLSKSPKFSPMKMATKLSVDDKPGYVLKNGLYRKLHKCKRCPYTNTRARNMQLHEMMHGPRQCSYPLMKCPYCDYYVGSKGLLSHHMKVHLKNYGDTPENDAAMASLGATDDDDGSDTEIQTQQKVDTLLSISRFKRFGCEKCPYASAKRQHFERHLELHGSRQRYTCQYCDYSVPSSYLLTQHSKLHLMPNQNLLASQSITNLQHMGEVPADVALASALPPTDRDMPVTISVIHDHLGLYENSIYDSEPKKLYRCDRCPYANVRRDYLLSHLKFHMVPSSLVCPYCDYSAPKQALLIQHIRVHFCPLPELSDWLLENGQTERETNQRNIDLAEALKVAHEYQNQSKKRSKCGKSEAAYNTGKDEDTEEKENVEEGPGVTSSQTLICQYCDREFSSSEKLVKHELQHLIGNQFEMALKCVSEDQQPTASNKESPKPESNGEAVEMKEGFKDDLQGRNPDESLNEVGGGSPVQLEITGDDSLNLELSLDTNFSEDHDLSAVEISKEKEDAPNLETDTKLEVQKEEKEKGNEKEKAMDELGDGNQMTHVKEDGDGHDTLARKDPQELKHGTESGEDSHSNTKTNCVTGTREGNDSEVFHDSASDPTALLKKGDDQEVKKDDTEQSTQAQKDQEKCEQKSDSKEEITDVIGKIETILEDVDMPEIKDTSVEEDFKAVLSSTPSKGNENVLKGTKEEKSTHVEDSKYVKEPGKEDKEDEGQEGSEEKMETSDSNTQDQFEQEKMDFDGKTTNDLTEKLPADKAKELEPKDAQSKGKIEVGKEISGDNAMEKKSGEEILKKSEEEFKNSFDEKKKEDYVENVNDDVMEKESLTKSQELAANQVNEELNRNNVKKESAEEGTGVDKLEKKSTVPEEAEKGSKPNGDTLL